jgi:hypothetical protein
MKILHVYKDYYPPVKGGIECHINLLTNGLKAKGIDVQVLVSNTKNRFQIDRFNGVMVAKAAIGKVLFCSFDPDVSSLFETIW